MQDSLSQIAQIAHSAFLFCVFVRKVEIKEHEDAGLCIHAEQRDEPDPHGDAHVVPQQVEEPYGAYRGKGHSEHDNSGLGRRAGIGVEQ